MDMTSLVFSILFGIIGTGYFAYGKRQNGYFALAGGALMFYPYFLDSFFGLVAIGVGFTFLPFALTRYR